MAMMMTSALLLLAPADALRSSFIRRSIVSMSSSVPDTKTVDITQAQREVLDLLDGMEEQKQRQKPVSRFAALQQEKKEAAAKMYKAKAEAYEATQLKSAEEAAIQAAATARAKAERSAKVAAYTDRAVHLAFSSGGGAVTDQIALDDDKNLMPPRPMVRLTREAIRDSEKTMSSALLAGERLAEVCKDVGSLDIAEGVASLKRAIEEARDAGMRAEVRGPSPRAEQRACQRRHTSSHAHDQTSCSPSCVPLAQLPGLKKATALVAILEKAALEADVDAADAPADDRHLMMDAIFSETYSVPDGEIQEIDEVWGMVPVVAVPKVAKAVPRAEDPTAETARDRAEAIAMAKAVAVANAAAKRSARMPWD